MQVLNYFLWPWDLQEVWHFYKKSSPWAVRLQHWNQSPPHIPGPQEGCTSQTRWETFRSFYAHITSTTGRTITHKIEKVFWYLVLLTTSSHFLVVSSFADADTLLTVWIRIVTLGAVLTQRPDRTLRTFTSWNTRAQKTVGIFSEFCRKKLFSFSHMK